MTRKVDRGTPSSSRERPIVEALDGLCLMIAGRGGDEARAVGCGLRREFESDLSVLAHLLPNVRSLLLGVDGAEPASSAAAAAAAAGRGDRNPSPSAEERRALTSSNVQFVLQRFLRVVSSPSNPVVFFLDDLQVRCFEACNFLFALHRFVIWLLIMLAARYLQSGRAGCCWTSSTRWFPTGGAHPASFSSGRTGEL